MMKQSTGDPQGTPSRGLEHLLQQVERSTSHYEALSVERSASDAQIIAAYQQATAVLQPWRTALEARGEAAADALARVELAASRLAYAYSVLSNPNKRIEYDRFVVVRTPGPLMNDAAPPPVAKPVASPRALELRVASAPVSEAKENRRRSQRVPLSAKAAIIGYHRKTGKWAEEAETVDASRTGVTLRLRHRVRHGNVLYMSLPLPAHLRSHGADEPEYRVYALVRRVHPVKDGIRVTALEFVGEEPPAGYLEKPWATFQTKPWSGAERRRAPRKPGGQMIWVEYFTEDLQCLRQEAGRTEDVSDGGLRIAIKGAPPEFEFVRVSAPERGIESYAIVCNRFLKDDGLERLCLRLIGNAELTERAVSRPEVEVSAAAMKAAPTPIRGRILVADDDLPLRRVLGKILSSAGYEVVLVEDGKAAVEKAAEIKPDLVITDGLMPKMHGFLVCKALKEMQPAPKVIMLTAVYTKLNYRFEARDRYGADELLTKPFEVANLLKCIERHLGSASQAMAG